ncbi:MAG: hypothetical protein Q4P30_06025, partial [Eubacteriales bacterium]|nr:hypothetical protein [Eubacteriales bacterium]
IRMWFWLVILITLGFALLTQCSLSKPKRIEHIVADCTKNIPFFPSWADDLKRHGIRDVPESGLPEYYCRCTIGESLQTLSEK